MKTRLSSLIAAVALLGLTPGIPVAQETDDPAPLLLILDASGSMWGQIEGTNKIIIAREVLADLVDGLPAASEVGVIAYGHRREGDCNDIETVVPMGPLDREALKSTVNALNPRGKTPITRSVQEAFGLLQEREGGATIILVSDGLETCDGDPCAAVRAAKESGIEFVMHVIGFDVAGEDVSSLECSAQAGDGLFLSAENAGELSAALDRAVAMPAEVPAGRLSVRAVANGELHDAVVQVTWADSGEEAGGGRTYSSPETNPRVVPLPDGRFDVVVKAAGIKGDTTRSFEIEIVDGSAVEKEVDYSTGTLSVGVTRNGELSDAVYRVHVAETGQEVAGGRTYTSNRSNPANVTIVSGTYEVSVGSVEMNNKPWAKLGTVTVEPRGSASVSHDFVSGTLKVGAHRGGELVDATLNVVSIEAGKSFGGGRTYTSETSNPKSFILPPGSYEVEIREIRGDRIKVTVEVTQGEVVERMVDLSAGDD